MTGKPDVIPGEKFALPVTWVRGIKLRLFAFSSVAASHDSFATGLLSGRPIFVQSTSYIWLRIVTTACWTTLSSSAAMPSGCCRPSAFGIKTLLEGFARYVPRCTRAVQIDKSILQPGFILLPRYAVYSGRGLTLKRVEAVAE